MNQKPSPITPDVVRQIFIVYDKAGELKAYAERWSADERVNAMPETDEVLVQINVHDAHNEDEESWCYPAVRSTRLKKKTRVDPYPRPERAPQVEPEEPVDELNTAAAQEEQPLPAKKRGRPQGSKKKGEASDNPGKQFTR